MQKHQNLSTNQETPYANLSPEVVLGAVESLGYRCTGAIFAMNSYENRVYDIGIENAENIVVKFYRPHRWTREQINEEHQFAFDLQQVEVPIEPPLQFDGKSLFEYENYMFSLYHKRGGRSFEFRTDEDYRQMGRLVARIHNVGAWEKFQHRPTLTVERLGWNSLTFLRSSGLIPADLVTAYDATATYLLNKIDNIWGNRNFSLRVHGDCHLGNILTDSTETFFLDLDDCCSGPAIQDLWLFTSGEMNDVSKQLGLLLEGYAQIRDFDFTELPLVEVLRSLRMIHYSAWIAKRWQDPTFPKNFPFFDTQDYWQRHLLNLKEQMARLDEAILVSI